MWLLPVPDIRARRATKFALAGTPFLFPNQSKIKSPKENLLRGLGLWSL
jgi:hypothetical protein